MNFSRQTTGEEGLDLLNEIKSKRPDLPVILITAWGSIELAVKGMKAGAADFVTKPWQNERVVSSVKTALNLVASGIRNGTRRVPHATNWTRNTISAASWVRIRRSCGSWIWPGR